MKLLSLNLWGGRVFEPLIRFIKDQSASTDIFCFQELFKSDQEEIMNSGARAGIYNELKENLAGYQNIFSSMMDNWDTRSTVDFSLNFGPGIFFKNNFKLIESGEMIIYGERNKLISHGNQMFPPGFMQFIRLAYKNKELLVCNVHAFAGWPKSDTPERIQQSQKILDSLNQYPDIPKIICGDFNLFYNTESIAMLSRVFNNLIQKYGVLHTRGPLFQGKEDEISDYVFTSPNLRIMNFNVPWVGVSDHLPLILEFDE